MNSYSQEPHFPRLQTSSAASAHRGSASVSAASASTAPVALYSCISASQQAGRRSNKNLGPNAIDIQQPAEQQPGSRAQMGIGNYCCGLKQQQQITPRRGNLSAAGGDYSSSGGSGLKGSAPRCSESNSVAIFQTPSSATSCAVTFA